MRILDLFAGIGGERRRETIEELGHEYITLDIDPKLNCNITADIFSVNGSYFTGFDLIWSSPPCESFSVASVSHHWNIDRTPKSENAKYSLRLINKLILFLDEAKPKYFVIENPRGMLRKMDAMQGIQRDTVTYCQYGDTRMKPTDVWNNINSWKPRPMCKRGDSCHRAAPRGSKTGTQGITGYYERSVVPVQLWIEILESIQSQEAK